MAVCPTFRADKLLAVTRLLNMKTLLALLAFALLTVGACQSQTTQIVSPLDGSTIKFNRKGINIQTLWTADFFPATMTVYVDGQIIESGYFFVSPFTDNLKWLDTVGVHTIESEVLEIDPLGNYLRSYAYATVTVVK